MKTAAWIMFAAAILTATAAMAAEANVPVTKVTAFSSGVAYYEHNGKVADDAEVMLKFKTDQINDVLKSLVVLDLGQGVVSGVNYSSQEPLARALKSFGIDLSGDPTLGQMLKQLRGAEVAISLLNAGDKITGKIVSVETKTKQILPSNTLISYDVVNVLTPGGIRALSLEDIGSLALADEKLNAELNKALALLVEARDTNRKPLQINFAGKGQQDVRIGYINEAPVWKTSYRVVMGNKDDKGVEQMKMQGWAIVENTSDFDWEKIDLTLVSGRPISFIQDLYTPLYMPRPVVVPELYASLRPQTYEEGLEQAQQLTELKPAARREMAAKKAGGPPAAPMAAQADGLALADEKADKDMSGMYLQRASQALASGVASVAQAQSVGELFSYHIGTPVSLPRRKSAMLPIINQAIEARRVSIYNQSVMPKYPLNGLWLTNNTKDSLLAGPVTLFDGGTYAGDARIDNLSAKDKRLLSYAIDLKMTVDPSTENAQQRMVSLGIVRGVLIVSHRIEYAQTYVITNKADQPRTLVIEYPRRSERKLLIKEPAEQTPSLYRFETDVPADTGGKFEIREEQITSQEIGILPANVGALEYYATDGQIPAKIKDALLEVIKRKNALTLAEREEADTQKTINDLRTEQNSIRANLNAFVGDRSSEGWQTFSKKLLAVEKQIEDLQKTFTEQHAKSVMLRKDLEDYLNKLNIETMQTSPPAAVPAK
jgi:hypothetical protein